MKKITFSILVALVILTVSAIPIYATDPQYDWINGLPRQTDDTNYEWVNGLPFIIIQGAVTPTINISNTPTTKDFGLIQPATTCYAKGTQPNNPVVDGDCTFTITNNGSVCDIAISCTNFTGGNTWTLVSGTPTGDQIKLIAYYSGQNPASGVVLTTFNQTFKAALSGGATLKWDFSELTGGTGSGKNGTFSDPTQKTATITLTAS